MVDTPEHRSPTLLLVGASRGIGLAMAGAFTQKGWNVVGTVREDDRTGLHDLAETYPDQVSIERLDITMPDQIAALRGKLSGPAYDMLFVNAGTANHHQDETIAKTSDEEFVRVMLTNALGVMRTVEGLQGLVRPSGLTMADRPALRRGPGRIVVVGEGMVELARRDDRWRLAFGGDTLNTAVHLARFGRQVDYATALGSDSFSDELKCEWQREGLGTAMVLADPQRMPGLYAIRTDAAGERSFAYWRSDSAARRMFSLPGADALCDQASRADLLLFSLISLAILPDEGRERLLDLARAVRGNGGRVAFDGNYRAGLWTDAATARHWRDAAIACCDIGLPTAEDEAAIGDDGHGAAVSRRWRASGAGMVVTKLGAAGCLMDDGTLVPPPRELMPVDTSGAGDAFNAGFLHAHLAGDTDIAAALAGHRLAGWVISHPGAIPGRDDDAP